MQFANHLLTLEVEGGQHGRVEVYEVDSRFLRICVLHQQRNAACGVDLALLVDDDDKPVTKDGLLDGVAAEWAAWTVVQSNIPELQEGDIIGEGRQDEQIDS